LYDASLVTRPEIIVVSKAELATSVDVADMMEKRLGKRPLLISAVTGKGLPDLIRAVWEIVRDMREDEALAKQKAKLAAAAIPAEQPEKV
jgi:GTP-binding protein